MKTLTVLFVVVLTAAFAIEPLVLVETSGGPLGDLFELLDYITEEINSESLESDRISSQILAQCKEENEFRNEQVLKFYNKYLDSKQENDRCKQSSDLLEAKLQKLSKDIIFLNFLPLTVL